MKITALIPVWRRFEHLPEIVSAWAQQTDEVIVWDNSGGRAPKLGDASIASSKNYGGQIKFKAGALAEHEWLMVADDDWIPQPGFIERMAASLQDLGGEPFSRDIVLGIHGRKIGANAYREHQTHRADKVERPEPVDFLGRGYFGHRSNFMVDMIGCSDTRLDDLWWVRELRKAKGGRLRLYVPPNPLYRDTDEANDTHSISRMDDFWLARDAFVAANSREIRGET